MIEEQVNDNQDDKKEGVKKKKSVAGENKWETSHSVFSSKLEKNSVCSHYCISLKRVLVHVQLLLLLCI